MTCDFKVECPKCDWAGHASECQRKNLDPPEFACPKCGNGVISTYEFQGRLPCATTDYWQFR
uniref:Uncharacterized protein n=1 Tax=viral metagenome TaxID=1070528 RepID=A0A6M3X7K7_9ZZZZ